MSPPPAPPDFEVQDYPVASLRRRLLLVMLAVAAAAFVTWLITRPVQPVPPEKIPEPRRCASGETEHCVGGTVGVIVTAPAGEGAASAPR